MKKKNIKESCGKKFIFNRSLKVNSSIKHPVFLMESVNEILFIPKGAICLLLGLSGINENSVFVRIGDWVGNVNYKFITEVKK